MASLTPKQVSQVSQWVADGLSLSQIQGKISAELGVSMTYMDARFLVDDLNLSLVEKEEPKKLEPVVEPAPEGEAEAATPGVPVAVTVEVDTITRPGTMISGNVTFSDSQKADWYIDEAGRPGMVPRVPNYRPTQEDITDFQAKLDVALRQAGF